MINTNLPTQWQNTAYGPARWAKSIVTLVDYLRPRYPTLTFLGGLGDQTHISEGNTTAHNPVTRDPVTGEGIVLAVDLGVTDGDYAPLYEIRGLIDSHPDDPRMAGEGYMSGPDSYQSVWPFDGQLHDGGGDRGHLHVNVSAKYFPFQPDGYLPSMDLTTPWDFMAPPPAPTPEVPVQKDLILKVGDGDDIGQTWILLANGRYVPIANSTELAVWNDPRLTDTVMVAPGDVNGASITGATHASLRKQAGA